MWVRRAAIRPVPSYAQVPARALSEVEDNLAEDNDEARELLDQAFTRFEQTQPALAERISQALSGPIDETALALGYFLTLAIWLAFDTVFGSELDQITETALAGVEESLNLDEQIRLSDPAEAVDSDDVVAMEQPDILAFVNEHIDAALEANATEVDVDDVHAIYRLVLIEILALSYAVRAPSNWVMPATEFTA
ncbi:MAG: hypothetical protein HUU21_02465 [Polyangiaceae bacterium]|nr:hypothetical protein [Polyangiaceae bacterium]NUQ72397.1 hypothetical protein [Polyangiaceae bacterium]